MKTPGEKICEVEEYLPGRGTYADEDGGVYAKIVGKEKFNNIERTVSIVPPPGKRIPGINVVGSIVYGRVFQVLNKVALLHLYPYKTARFRLVPPGPIGAIYIGDVRREFVEDLHNEFEVGDWVRAKIKRIVKKFYPQLTTVGKDLGVIKAYCPHDRTPLVRRGAELYCPKCKRKFKRKIAFDYGDPKLPR
ncbi:MAG: RNA-binding protein [Candidatus Diapherotrites archaeon]|nr:RNA-binding protein [Candidatus Diapherotrites archaeon]